MGGNPELLRHEAGEALRVQEIVKIYWLNYCYVAVSEDTPGFDRNAVHDKLKYNKTNEMYTREFCKHSV